MSTGDGTTTRVPVADTGLPAGGLDLDQIPPEERARLPKPPENRFAAALVQIRDGSALITVLAVLIALVVGAVLIAVTDGVHPDELHYLDEVAARFGFPTDRYAQIRARYIAPSADDPYVVLGLMPGAPTEEVRAAYRALVKAYHPDRHMADGTPPEFIRVAEDRMAAINAAYAILMRRKSPAA